MHSRTRDVKRALSLSRARSLPRSLSRLVSCKQHVCFIGIEHSFANEVVVQAAMTFPMPSTLSWEEAASIPIVFLTAYHALARTAQLAAGETVLIHSAMGGLGQAAIQVARHLGASVFASAGSEAKRDALRDVHRIEGVTDSHSLNFARDALEWTGGAGVDVILNSLAGEYIDAGMRCLRPGGRFVEVGKRDISEGGSVGLKPFNHNLQFLSVQLDQLMLRRPEIVGDIAAAIVRQIATLSNCSAPIASLSSSH